MALTDGLLRAYNFDGNSTDDKGGYNGTDNSVTYNAGKIGQSVRFSGSKSSYIQAEGTSLPTGSSPFSAAVWFKQNGGNIQAFYGYGTTSGGDGRRNNLGLYDSGKLFFTGFGRDLNSGVVANDNKWHQGVITYNGTTAKIYLDGTLRNSANFSLNVQPGNLYIGKSESNDGEMTGDLDILQFWNREITSDEVSQLYNSGAGLQYPFSIGSSKFFQLF